MQIIPAIDLKDNKCVRLTRGKDETSIVFNDDPVKQAEFFQNSGCKTIHIVDLDAAFGRQDINFKSIQKIRKSISIPIQLGGGIRSKEDAEKYFELGIDNLIIGSMSVNQPQIVKELSIKYINKIYVSLDIEEGHVMLKGWKQKSNLKIDDVLKTYFGTKIKGYVITDIKNDGMLKGLDIEFIKKLSLKIYQKNNLTKKIILAGGLTDYKDLNNLNKINLKNIEGIVLGKAYYVGNIELDKAQKIFVRNGKN